MFKIYIKQRLSLLKKYLLLLGIVFLSCTNHNNSKTSVIPTNDANKTESEQLADPSNNTNKTESEQLADPLILGGKPYVDFHGKAYGKDEAELFTSLVCDLRHDAVVRLYSLEGLEHLINLKSLSIYGENLDTVDFTPLSSLYNLERLYIHGNITRLPDLTGLEQLTSIGIKYATLESFEGIGAPNIRSINISNGKEFDSLAPFNNLLYLEELEINGGGSKVYKIADMSNLPNLKRLGLLLYHTKIDLSGIENLSALENLDAGWTEPFNIEGIGKLEKLQQLYLNLISPQPSVEFLRNMPNLSVLYLEADGTRNRFPHETNAYQVLDVSPLSSLNKLQQLSCVNFIIKNISALDDNDLFSKSPSGISLWKSRLFDETEKSRHYLLFEIEKE